jgi:hypothetical protein
LVETFQASSSSASESWTPADTHTAWSKKPQRRGRRQHSHNTHTMHSGPHWKYQGLASSPRPSHQPTRLSLLHLQK